MLTFQQSQYRQITLSSAAFILSCVCCAGTLHCAVDALTELSGNPLWSCCGLRTDAPPSGKATIKQRLQDCTVQLFTGNSKAWLDHLQIAAPSQPLLPPAHLDPLQATTASADKHNRDDPVKPSGACAEAGGTTVHLLASCSDQTRSKLDAFNVDCGLQNALTDPVAVSAHEGTQQPCIAASVADKLNSVPLTHAAQQAAQADHAVSTAAESIVTQLLESMDQLQDITLKAVHLASRPDQHLTTVQHSISASDKTCPDRPSSSAGQSQGRKRQRPSQSLARELKALHASTSCLENGSSCHLGIHVATSSTASVRDTLSPETSSSQHSLRPTPARQTDQKQGKWTQQKSRFSRSRAAAVSWAGPNADSGDMEAIRRY